MWEFSLISTLLAKRLIFREIKSILAYFSAKFRYFDEIWFHLTKNSSFWQIFFIFSRQIDGIHTSQCSVEKLSKTRSLFFRKNQHFIHQINVFTKEVTKELISRKFLRVIAFYSVLLRKVFRYIGLDGGEQKSWEWFLKDI